MGILNVTPDSFSDGGDFLRHDVAVAHALRMLADGAAIVDVGGESTRPGAERVAADEEAARVVPVIAAIAAAGGTVSVDTMRAEVARRAVAAGARIVNDVSGGLADPDMVGVVAEAEADFVIMHWRAHSATMSDAAHYGDVVADVRDELLARRDAGGRHPGRSDHPRPRPRLREDVGPQLGPAAEPRHLHRPGASAARRGLPQGLPRRPARRPGAA